MIAASSIFNLLTWQLAYLLACLLACLVMWTGGLIMTWLTQVYTHRTVLVKRGKRFYCGNVPSEFMCVVSSVMALDSRLPVWEVLKSHGKKSRAYILSYELPPPLINKLPFTFAGEIFFFLLLFLFLHTIFFVSSCVFCSLSLIVMLHLITRLYLTLWHQQVILTINFPRK